MPRMGQAEKVAAHGQEFRIFARRQLIARHRQIDVDQPAEPARIGLQRDDLAAEIEGFVQVVGSLTVYS